MGESQPRKRFSFGEKAALVWLILFTAAALTSHILILQGQEAMAFPERALLPPFTSAEHLLGTDHLGRDVFYYLVLSCRTAWLLAIPPLVIASLAGVLLGTGAAILGNHGWRISLKRFLSIGFIILAFAALYPIVYHWPPLARYSVSSWLYDGSGILLFLYVLTKKERLSSNENSRGMAIAVDEGLQRIINIWSTLPKLLLLLILTAFAPFSLVTLMGWICATYWVLPARIARASVLQLKKESYYETAQALGIPFNRVFTHFILPSLKGPLLANFCFAASGLLGVGSTLAYLGIGIPPDVPSWGKMLANARFSVESWWLLVFPGIFLLASIFSLQVLGNRISASKEHKSVTK